MLATQPRSLDGPRRSRFGASRRRDERELETELAGHSGVKLPLHLKVIVEPLARGARFEQLRAKLLERQSEGRRDLPGDEREMVRVLAALLRTLDEKLSEHVEIAVRLAIVRQTAKLNYRWRWSEKFAGVGDRRSKPLVAYPIGKPRARDHAPKGTPVGLRQRSVAKTEEISGEST
jgi:hypothetical protein